MESFSISINVECRNDINTMTEVQPVFIKIFTNLSSKKAQNQDNIVFWQTKSLI